MYIRLISKIRRYQKVVLNEVRACPYSRRSDIESDVYVVLQGFSVGIIQHNDDDRASRAHCVGSALPVLLVCGVPPEEEPGIGEVGILVSPLMISCIEASNESTRVDIWPIRSSI